MIYEPRVEGHHVGYLHFITADLVGAGFDLTLAIDTRPAPLARIREEMGDLLEQVRVIPVCDDAGRRAGDGRAGSVAACLREAGADLAFLDTFDEIASSVLRRAAFGLMPPAGLRRRLGGVYLRPRFLAGLGLSPNSWIKAAGFGRLLRQRWFSHLFLLDPYLHADLKEREPDWPMFFLPDPHPGNFAADAANARRKLGVPEGRRVFLFYGGAYRRKGLPLTVQAMRQLAADVPAFLLCAGHQPKEAAVLRRLEQLTREGRALVINRYVSLEEERQLFAASDFVLLPYIKHFGSSGVLSRAAAAGKPVIASDEELVGRLVRDHGLGLLSPSGDAAGLSDVMAAAINAPAAETARWVAAARVFGERHSRDAFRAALVEGFNRAVAGLSAG